MADINTFIDAIGKDVNETVVPRVDQVAAQISATVRDFAISLIHDLSQRYRPEIAGELHTRIVQGGLEVTGQNVRLDLKRRDTGAPVASLDIPVSLKINVSGSCRQPSKDDHQARRRTLVLSTWSLVPGPSLVHQSLVHASPACGWTPDSGPRTDHGPSTKAQGPTRSIPLRP